MCGGITVFAPLIKYGAKPTDTVRVVGLRGLGHLAVQFARGMGCEVVVFSQTDSKKEDALRLGAFRFVTTQGKRDLTSEVPREITQLIVTTSGMPDWDLFLPILGAGATLFPLTATSMEAKLVIPHMPFLLKGAQVVSSIPSKNTYSDMLQFAARINIHPLLDREPLSTQGIESLLNRLQSGRIRYRGVLCKH